MINYSLSYRTRYVSEGGTRVKKAFAYGKAQASGSMTTADFAKECCKTSVYGSGVLAAVLVVLADEIVKKVKLSYTVNCGTLGTFSPGLSSKGVEDIATFSPAAHITKSYVKWNKPSRLARLDGPKYQLVATNADQNAMSKANKNASATVNLGDSSAKEVARTQNAPSEP